MSRENKSWFAILGLISKRDMSGYDIKQIVNTRSNFFWSESNAQIYPILKQLEANKLVVSRIDENSGARNRRIYAITSEGLQVLKDWLAKPSEQAIYREEMLLKLSLGQHLSNELNILHVLDYKNELLGQQKKLATTFTHIEQDHKNKADYNYILMTYNYSKLVIEAKLEWCRQTLLELKKLK